MKYGKNIAGYSENFRINYGQTILNIGINDFSREKNTLCQEIRNTVIRHYEHIQIIMEENPDFRYSLLPFDLDTHNYKEAEQLIGFSKKAGVGPMAGIAGFFDEIVSDFLSGCSEDYCIENGGDIKIKCKSEKKINIFSTSEDFQDSINILLPAGEYGIASSSGKKGHSLSFGNADLVTVICGNAIEADCFATAIGNMAVDQSSAESIINKFDFLEGIFIFMKDKMWYKGKFKISL